MKSKTEQYRELLKHFQDDNETEEDIMRILTEPEKTTIRPYDGSTTTPRLAKIDSQITKNLDMSALHRETGRFSEQGISPTSRSMSLATFEERNGLFLPQTSSASSYKSSFPSDESKIEKEPIKLTRGYKKLKNPFARIKDCTFISLSSPSGIYNEISVVIWLDSSGTGHLSSDKSRLVISMVYDSQEDLWSVSAKLFKRAYYATKDDEEGSVPNRLCKANELRKELKGLLLYLGFSPREVYMNVRRTMREDLVFGGKEFGLFTVESEHHAKMLEILEKTTSYQTLNQSGGTWDHHNNWHGKTNHMSHQSIKDNMKDMRRPSLYDY